MLKIISHRGNLNGPIPEKENSIDYIDKAIRTGYDVEVDVRTKDGSLHLGHDFAQNKISYNELAYREGSLWVHCKDIDSFFVCRNLRSFCHTADPFCLIHNYSPINNYLPLVWVHDLSLNLNHISVIPLLSIQDIDNFDLGQAKNIYGICTDYPNYLSEKLYGQK